MAIGAVGVRVRPAAARCGASRTRACGGTARSRAIRAGAGRGGRRRRRRRRRSGSPARCTALVLLDAADEVLRPAILWNDQRTAAECDAIRAAVGAERLVEITGNDALTGFTAPKLVWVRDARARGLGAGRPRPAAQGLRARCRLTGEHAMDKADGAGTHPVRPRRARLVAGDARRAGHRPARGCRRRSRARRSPARSPPTAAAATGLRAGTPVVAGGGDQAANAVGVGAVAPGRVALSLGTSGVVFATTDRPLFEPARPGPRLLPRGARALAHDVGDALGRRQPALVPRRARAGRGVRRARRRRPPRCPAGSDGLLFLPYLSGERSPHPDPLARGAFVGPDARPRPAAPDPGRPRGRRVRAARRPRPDDRRRDAGAGPDPRVGRRHGQRRCGARSWPTSCGPRSRRSSTTEGAAYGAALLAAVGAGWFPTVEAAADAVVGRDAGRGARARRRRATPSAHARYRELYPALAPSFRRL